MDLWDSKPSEFSIINIKMQEQVDILINDKLPFPYVSLINKLLFHAAIFYGKIKGSAVVLLRNIENFQSCFPFCLSQCLHWIIRFTSVVISFEKAGVDVKVGQNLLLCWDNFLQMDLWYAKKIWYWATFIKKKFVCSPHTN